jgi:hypothetical protein
VRIPEKLRQRRTAGFAQLPLVRAVLWPRLTSEVHMRNVIISVGLGLMLLIPAAASAAAPVKTKSPKPVHARAVKHAKLKTPAKQPRSKHAAVDNKLMTPKWM